MNVKDYISSGIVEAYVMGLADETERIEFESMCAQYPEVELARNAFEILIEQNAVESAVPPPAHLKGKIHDAIKKEETRSAPVIPFSTPRDRSSRKGISWVNRYLSVAAMLLLVVSTALNFYLFRKYKTVSESYAASQAVLADTQAQNVKLQEYASAIDLMKSPDISVVQMPASTVPTSPDPNSLAVVFWNTRTKDVYLMFNNMPAPQSDMQYQLWAIVDGKPVDAGLVTSSGDNVLIRMKKISNANAFAVTLEKSGGSLSPQGQMYVLGNVKT